MLILKVLVEKIALGCVIVTVCLDYELLLTRSHHCRVNIDITTRSTIAHLLQGAPCSSLVDVLVIVDRCRRGDRRVVHMMVMMVMYMGHHLGRGYQTLKGDSVWLPMMAHF